MTKTPLAIGLRVKASLTSWHQSIKTSEIMDKLDGCRDKNGPSYDELYEGGQTKAREALVRSIRRY